MMGLQRGRVAAVRAWPGRVAEDGFALAEGLFDPDELSRLRDAIDGLFGDYSRLPAGHVYDLDRRPEDGSPGRIPAIRDVLRLRPELRGSRGLAGAVALAEGLVGPGAEVLWDSAVYKPPGRSSETPWHQDEAVYGLSGIRRPRSIVYIWIALDAVGESSGCMRFVPGSHLGPVLRHSWRNGDPSTSLVLSEPVEESAAVSVPLGPGDATVHHSRTIHGSGPNTSGLCRKAWILGVGRPRAPRWLRRLKRGLLGLAGRSGGH
jgi:hypothetical protein